MPSSRPGWSPQGPLLRIGSALAAWRTPKTRRLFRELTVANAGADAITLTAQESATLSACANGSRVAHRDVVRARIVLAAAQGVSNAPVPWACTWTPSANGGDGSPRAGSQACTTVLAVGGRGCS